MPDILLELFSEEIPARMQARAAQDLRRLITEGLVEAGITYEGAAAFATPRRLCLTVSGALAQSPTLREERKGPRVDAPQKAIEGFLRATGLSREQLEIRDEKKGQLYFAILERPGRAVGDILAEVLEHCIRNFPWPKSMRWGSGSLRWVRPLHSILCILHDESGTSTVPLQIDHLVSGNTTRGHRFMAPDAFTVTSFDDYVAKLRRAHVILDAESRAEQIWADAQNQAFALGLEVVPDPALLAEVAGLVEWPVVLVGDIAKDFSELPAEVLQTSMREHQKFFSLRDPATGQIEKFVTVANRETVDQGATILAGNQKVLFARLSDAKFFWQNDLRKIAKDGMAEMAAGLSNVTFHNKLGSQADRVQRIAALAREIAPLVGAEPAQAALAATIAKADLQSEMVGEFPELQGVMGLYYARKSGLPPEVATACAEHYAPLGPKDTVPDAPVSIAVALADKIDTLCGFWAIDEKPTGSKDPFALRRAALGVIRLVLNNALRLDLLEIFQKASANFATLSGASDTFQSDLLTFFHDRLKVHLRDQGLRHDVIDACLAMAHNDDLLLLVNRATALSDFLKTEDGTNLLQGFKRANNILTAEEKKDGVAYEGAPEMRFAEDASETALFDALDRAETAIRSAADAEDFAAAMAAMAALRQPIDAFFTAVQINCENQIVRRNRLCLLNRIREVMAPVARFELLDG